MPDTVDFFFQPCYLYMGNKDMDFLNIYHVPPKGWPVFVDTITMGNGKNVDILVVYEVWSGFIL
jgi:hypothetical protein